MMDIVIDIIFRIMFFVIGLILAVNGFGEAVNFMGDRVSAWTEKFLGLVVMIVGVVLINMAFK